MANSTQIDSNGRKNSLMEDRFSSLPDDILTNILSLLPTILAAKTAFFSRRWRHLWKTVTTVEFSTRGIQFNKVSKLLNTLTSPNIRVFNYTFYGSSIDFNWQSAENLFLLLFRRNVEVLKLTSRSSELIATYLPVPNCVFNCETLVNLKLDGYLDCKLDFNEEDILAVNGDRVNLPNLKILVLRVRADDYDHSRSLLRTLLKCCPLLEDLSLLVEFSEENEIDWYIVAPNVKVMNVEVVVPVSCSYIIIDAPKLVKLKVTDTCLYYEFKSIPTMLVEANIKLKKVQGTNWLPPFDDVNSWTLPGHDDSISDFVRGICSVRSLKLQCYGNVHFFVGPNAYADMAVFPHLTFFKTTIDGIPGLEDLLRSLHCFPNLEHLELKMDDVYNLGQPYWVSPIVLPECLLTKLKRITVKKVKQNMQEIKLLEFILNHANVLEELRVCPEFFSDFFMTQCNQLWEEYKFCHALFKLPRSSSTCKIVLSGVYIKASSNAVENKVMNCQISFKKLEDSDSD